MNKRPSHVWYLARLVCEDDYIDVFLALDEERRPAATTPAMVFKGTWGGDDGFGEFVAQPDDHFFYWHGDTEPMATDLGTAPVRVGQRIFVRTAYERYDYTVSTLVKLNA